CPLRWGGPSRSITPATTPATQRFSAKASAKPIFNLLWLFAASAMVLFLSQEQIAGGGDPKIQPIAQHIRQPIRGDRTAIANRHPRHRGRGQTRRHYPAAQSRRESARPAPPDRSGRLGGGRRRSGN